MELPVRISAQLVESRLVIERLPDEIVETRLRNKYAAAKKKGIKISKESIVRASLNLYITNSTIEQCPAEHVRKLYQLRWQIELIFKAFKSKMNIDKVKRTIKVERFECFLLAQLIYIVLHFYLFYELNNRTWKEYKVLVSVISFFSKCLLYFNDFTKACKQGDLESYLNELLEFDKHVIKEKRKDADNHDEVLQLVFRYG